MKAVEVKHCGIWEPTQEMIDATNVAWLMQRAGVDNYEALHDWSIQRRELFWESVVERLAIPFQTPFDRIVDVSEGVASPKWFPGGKLNIVESCFNAAADSTAIIYQHEAGELETLTVRELRAFASRVADGLRQRGFKPGDAIAILMPMTVECVAIYLGTAWAGCVAVSIADSFQPKEIATRLKLSGAVGIFTQDVFRRGGKSHPLFAGVKQAGAPAAIVVSEGSTAELRDGDCHWSDFLGDDEDAPVAVCEPSDPMNILFSSGTTGDPKVIPWTHTTPIKCAADSHFHQNIQPGDVAVWPTNIGWMMGPWLIFSALMNRASMGLYYGSPTGAEFCRFVQDARTTMLGVIPSLVKTWRAADAAQGLDWSSIELFSTTGECSAADDMRWLMEQAGGRPVIEYCGGTELGGGYIASTLALPCKVGEFNTPTLGTEMVILDAEGQPADSGEAFLVPPTIGMSTQLLNRDHHKSYYAATPCRHEGDVLRRHGDQIQRIPAGGWRAMGRADDTMNLGGIKVGSAEIERVLQGVAGLSETAAIGVAPDGGPSQLVIYVVLAKDVTIEKKELMAAMQSAIRKELNPLFKIHDIIPVDVMPRTASNKVMRRVLRDQYLQHAKGCS
ncbi:AMP-binding protein [Rosistilla oblonga]|uniref:AMP-binding protein n=1 Tax=Rosistilla oblonga TaxID=2527990 RepID=UPI003A97C6A3